MKFFDKIFGINQADPEVILQAQAAVGNAFLEFKDSDVGRYMILRAEQEELETLRRLVHADPTNTVQIIRLQEEAKATAKIVNWMENVINEGEMAKKTLEEHAAYESGI